MQGAALRGRQLAEHFGVAPRCRASPVGPLEGAARQAGAVRALGATLGPVKAVTYRQDRSAVERLIASRIREDIIRPKGRASVQGTLVPHAKAYKEAATLRIRVHRHERRCDGVMPSARTVMHQSAWELFGSLQGVHADNSRAVRQP